MGDVNIGFASSTSPAFNPHKFLVYRNSAWTDGNASFSKVNFDTITYDTNGNFDNVTNFRYTAPVAGFYFFTATVSASVTSGSTANTALYKNGSELMRGNQHVSGGTTTTDAGVVSALIQLAATDFIEIFHAGTGGTGNTGNAPFLTYFQGFLVSRA